MALNALRGRGGRGRPIAPEPLAIGEVEGDIFGCPVCARPLAPDARRCQGCGTRLVFRVPARKASLFVAVGLATGLVIGSVVAAWAASGRPVVIAAAPLPVPGAAVSATPVPAATPRSSVPAMARSAVGQAAELHVRLGTAGLSLEAYLQARNLDVSAVARVLRSLVSDAGYGVGLAPRIGGWDEAGSVAAELEAFYSQVREVARGGLRASLANDTAYRSASVAMVALLADLQSLDARTRELAVKAGIEVPPLPAAASVAP